MKDVKNTQQAQAESKRLSIWQTQQLVRDQVTMNRWCTNMRRNNLFAR
jgi:hypothetical protein